MAEPEPRLSLSLNNVVPALVAGAVSFAVAWGTFSSELTHVKQTNTAQDAAIATLQTGHAAKDARDSANAVQINFVQRDLGEVKSAVNALVVEIREMREARIMPARGHR